MTRTFQGATVCLPDQIAEIGGPAQGSAQGEIVDASGRILAPAVIDLHGDAFERQVMPRPGTYFPHDVAALDTDRQLAANAIATAYLAITLG
ncbi:hypothetical protein [Jannaschia seohaensis]|uniref:Alpha-D-ribose 1-methylphosphonate 5-triphosphate diphosphatase n=1 Tax=Jannaschia seohaensis TaxID=475081 RepID=A0A2Y9ATI4_9RHOB|nr:hypothetical protein [Jannaschia seohaensis]PWJ18123.1 alpha-D-ribose 1-methylphosphonate 5-triphosphate diphosphatase [Jannaschia seohaensis]SSA46648.1 alpha-D-ribose 1-methylphosphonate 5-triphosphate diphosphatase [Jannaschia seohaensis]